MKWRQCAAKLDAAEGRVGVPCDIYQPPTMALVSAEFYPQDTSLFALKSQRSAVCIALTPAASRAVSSSKRGVVSSLSQTLARGSCTTGSRNEAEDLQGGAPTCESSCACCSISRLTQARTYRCDAPCDSQVLAGDAALAECITCDCRLQQRS